MTSILILCLTAWLFIVGGLFGCGGCATGKGQYSPTTGIYDTNAVADSVVVTAESLRDAALTVFDSFMRVERENEAVLKAINPELHQAAEQIRKNGKGWLDDLTNAKIAYQSARTPENASKLNSALAAVRSALVSASKRLAEASTVKKP